jgi:hypothetical protein
VPIDDIPPVLLPLDALVPIFEVLRLVPVPAVLNKLPFVDVDGVGPKGGMGDLAWEDEVMRREGALLPLDELTVAEGREVTIVGTFFGATTNDGGALFLILLGATLGIFEGAALAGTAVFPRPKTFCTRDLAEDKNPNLPGVG